MLCLEQWLVKDETRDIGTIKDADGNVLQENAIESKKRNMDRLGKEQEQKMLYKE